MPSAIERLKQSAEAGGSDSPSNSSCSQRCVTPGNDRREKSLAALSGRFVELFLEGDNPKGTVVALHDAAAALSSKKHTSPVTTG